MSEYKNNTQSEPNPSAEKWRIEGDLYDEPKEENPRKTLGERHLSFLPGAAHQLEEIGRRGGLTEEQRRHLREDTLNQLGTADYGSAAVVYEDDDRGPVASHYISLEDDTFGQPITDPEAHGLPIITGLARGDEVPEVHAGQEVSRQPIPEMLPESRTSSLSSDESAERASETNEDAAEAKTEAPVLTREQRWRRKATLGELQKSVESTATDSLINKYYEFEAAVSGSLYLSPSELTISSIEDALASWGRVVREERTAIDSLRDALDTYREFDLKGKVLPLGQTYVQSMEAELSDIEDQSRRLGNDDMENARLYGQFEGSMIRGRMNDMLDRIERIKGYRSQLRYLIEGEEEPVASADEEVPEESVLAKLEANHEGLDIDEVTAQRAPNPEEEDFSQESFMEQGGYGRHYRPKKGTSLIERQRGRGVIEE